MACHNYSSCATLKHHPGLASILTAGNPAVGPNSSHAGTQPLSGLVTDASNATALASWAVGNGSDYFKITLEVNGPSYNLTRRLVRAVHDLGQKAMSHASEVNSYTQASETGIDGIQHTAQDGLLSAAVIQRIKLNKQFVTPTLTIHSFGLNPPNLAVLTAIKGNPDPGNWSWADVVSNARAMYQAGIPLITGTDAVGPLAPGLSVPFGKTLHEELWHFVDDVGMSPAEAVDAATRVAARHHELRDRGVIRTGMRADLVLLGSDPLVDIRNTMDIRGVWVEGRRFSGDLRIRA
jgi:imidazolonepropionase-like amidohydrolase